MNIDIRKRTVVDFTKHFSNSPTLCIQAPGRINLIGEHTDYNNGFVLPAAIDKSIYFAFAKNNSNTARFVALDKQESYNFDLQNANNLLNHGWQKYAVGMAFSFLNKEQGFDCVFGGDLPIGAGISSSSALCCGLAYGLNLLFDIGYDKKQMTPLIQKAEAKYSGVNGGIMDQFSIMMGQKDKVILLDCKDLSTKYFPLELQDNCLLLCNTAVEHELASTQYNNRRRECEAGIGLLNKSGLIIESLREVTLSMLEQHRSSFDPLTFKRCAYVVKENKRVLETVTALSQGDLNAVGELLYQSHEGLQHDYEVSCPELDFLVNFAKSQDYVLGARMMGGGFGGCTLNLLPKSKVATFLEKAGKAYFDRFSIKLKGHKVLTGNGVTPFTIS